MKAQEPDELQDFIGGTDVRKELYMQWIESAKNDPEINEEQKIQR